jgi:hypothetical protein
MSVAVGDKFLTFPFHVTERQNGNVQMNANTMNPGFFTPTGVTRNAALQNMVGRRVLTQDVLRKLRFAVVDLTGPEKLANPQFAGNRETEQGGCGSMAKLACMFAAFQLQFDLQSMAQRLNITSQKKLFDGARGVWDFLQIRTKTAPVPIFPANPKIERGSDLIFIDGRRVPIPRPFSSPDLEQMFKFDGKTLAFVGDDKVNLQGGPDLSPGVDDYARDFPEGNLPAVRKLSFAERMFLMIDDSDNPAAKTCIENVSFGYIASSLWQSDIYRPERGGGLWEASDHLDKQHGHWIMPPVPRGDPKSDFVSGTPASIASLFTLMAQDRLVSKQASLQMRGLTSRRKTSVPGGSFNRSFFKEGLRAVGIRPKEFHAKIGIGNFRNDVALIVRDVGEKEIRYVAVGCDDPHADGDDLDKLIVGLDKCIRENNGLLASDIP